MVQDRRGVRIALFRMRCRRAWRLPAHFTGALVVGHQITFSRGGGNFVERILRAARERGALQVVADQHLTPTFCGDLAAVLLAAGDGDARGVAHLTNDGACSWHAFTEEILRLAGVDVPVEPIATLPRPGVADRPRNGVLARPRADALGLPVLRPWPAALADYVRQAGLGVD